MAGIHTSKPDCQTYKSIGYGYNAQGNRIKILGDKQRWRCVNDDRCREIL
ncbi:hypothetical protein [Duncaniella muris]|nr:hypothetical protein [Duncaniella muris]